MTAAPVGFWQSPGSLRLMPPRPGEHNKALLGELGYDLDEIAEITGMPPG